MGFAMVLITETSAIFTCVDLSSSGKRGFLPQFYLCFPSLKSVQRHAEAIGVTSVGL